MSQDSGVPDSLHQSVLVSEVLEWLRPRTGKVYIDGTVGLGGHAARILESSAPDGRLIGFDKDEEALSEAHRVLSRFGERAMLIHDDFKNIPLYREAMGGKKAHGILLDLGVSSLQLNKAERGFSFLRQGPLDMRMDRRSALTAKEIVNRFSPEKLLEILWTFGEERFARRIVSRLVEARSKKPIESTGELEAIVRKAVPARIRAGRRIHPATRTFQALRIAANGEMKSLESFLSTAPDLLEKEGRLAILSFHSLEDRAVKTAFRELRRQKAGRVLTPKPLSPSPEETDSNPRSRSAKLRVFEKMSEGGGAA